MAITDEQIDAIKRRHLNGYSLTILQAGTLLDCLTERDATIAELREKLRSETLDLSQRLDFMQASSDHFERTSSATSQRANLLEVQLRDAMSQLAELRLQIEANQMTFRGMEQSKINLLQQIDDLRKPVVVERNKTVEEIRSVLLRGEADNMDLDAMIAEYDTLAQNHAREVNAREAIAAEMRGLRAELDSTRFNLAHFKELHLKTQG